MIATFVHADKFRFDLFTGWLWLFLYVEEPLWMVFLVWRAAREPLEPVTRAATPLPAFRLFLAVEAMILCQSAASCSLHQKASTRSGLGN